MCIKYTYSAVNRSSEIVCRYTHNLFICNNCSRGGTMITIWKMMHQTRTIKTICLSNFFQQRQKAKIKNTCKDKHSLFSDWTPWWRCVTRHDRLVQYLIFIADLIWSIVKQWCVCAFYNIPETVGRGYVCLEAGGRGAVGVEPGETGAVLDSVS